MTQSKELTAFYDAYLDWAEGGENVYGFKAQFGLCHAVDTFDNLDGSVRLTGVYGEMQRQFRAAGLWSAYPFEGEIAYELSTDKRLDPKRMAWVRAHSSKGGEN